MPLNSTIVPEECNFGDIMERIGFHLKLTPYLDRKALIDKARFFFASPKDAEVHTIEGTKVIKWKDFDYKKATRVTFTKHYSSGETLANELDPNFQFTLPNGSTKTFAEFEYITGGDTEPTRCWNKDFGHKNGDQNPSGFIGRHFNGTLMANCSSGCDTKFIHK